MEHGDLKKLNRRELLEILLEQSKIIEQLESELSKMKEKYKEQKITINESGTLAEASLKLTEIFKAADEAVEIYTNNAKELLKQDEKKFKKECREMKQKMLDEVDKKCRTRELESEKRLKEIEDKIARKQKYKSKKVKGKNNKVRKTETVSSKEETKENEK